MKKGLIRDYLLLGITLIVTFVVLLVFPEKLDTVIITSKGYFVQMMIILPAVMVMIGLFTVWVSKEMVIKYLGRNSGVKGLFLAILFGALPTGSLYVAFPLAAVLLKKGASISNIIVFLSAWACIKLPQEMMELQFLGWKFMMLRLVLTIMFVSVMGVSIEHIIERDNKKNSKEVRYANL